MRIGALLILFVVACKGGGDKAELPQAKSVKEAPVVADAAPGTAADAAPAATDTPTPREEPDTPTPDRGATERAALTRTAEAREPTPTNTPIR